MLVLSPVLGDVARDLGVSTATAGQLRSLSGLTGGATAVLLALAPRRPSLRDLLSGGAALVAAGSALSAAAPSFALLAAAQGVAGIGIGVLVAVGIAAAGEWPPAEERPRVLAWAIAGMPAAWIVGMPVVGALANVNWRAAWLVPTVVALVAVGVVRRRPAERPSSRARGRSGRMAGPGGREVRPRRAAGQCGVGERADLRGRPPARELRPHPGRRRARARGHGRRHGARYVPRAPPCLPGHAGAAGGPHGLSSGRRRGARHDAPGRRPSRSPCSPRWRSSTAGARWSPARSAWTPRRRTGSP